MLKIGSVYSSNSCGDFKIVNHEVSNSVDVEFLSTGYKASFTPRNITDGGVKDKLHPSVFGVGFFGDGLHRSRDHGGVSKAYRAWTGMLERCYCPKLQKKHPTYACVTAIKDWHNFQNFAEWFGRNYIDGSHLDKDINQRGVKYKVYSPETCVFVSSKDNSVEASAKHYKMRDPDGIVRYIYNMRELCRENGLTPSAMSLVYSGVRKHHKGWRL